MFGLNPYYPSSGKLPGKLVKNFYSESYFSAVPFPMVKKISYVKEAKNTRNKERVV